MTAKTASPAGKANPLASLFSVDELRKLWGDLKPEILLERLRATKPDHKWVIRGARITGRCPYHEDGTPSFHLYLDRGYGKCYGCDRFVNNPIQFWAHLQGMTLTQAMADIKQSFGLSTLTKSSSTEVLAWEQNQALKVKIVDIAHMQLVNAIAQKCEGPYEYAKEAVDYLLNVRKVPSDAIPSLTFLGILPPTHIILTQLEREAKARQALEREKAEAEGKKFVDRSAGIETIAAKYLESVSGLAGWLLFEQDTSPDSIGWLKLRKPNTKEFHILSDDYSLVGGCMGMRWPHYKPLLATKQYVPGVYIVEGEFDALSIMAQMVMAGGPSFIVLSTGGTANKDVLDSFYALGFEEIYLWSDAPVKNGDALIRHWLPGIRRLRTKIFCNYAALNGATDPDSAVLTCGLPHIQALLLDINNTQNFITPPVWVFDRLQAELQVLANGDDLRVATEHAAVAGLMLKNAIDVDLFVDKCAKVLHLLPGTLRKAIAGNEDSEEGLIVRATHAYQTEFFVIGQEGSPTSRRLHLWHKGRRQKIAVSLSDASAIDREIAPIIGPRYQFFKEKVGLPSFLEQRESKKNSEPHLANIERFLQYYDKNAILMIAADAPDMDTAQTLAQGLHVKGDDWYLVSGSTVYKGLSRDGDVEVTELEGPRDGKVVFNIDTALNAAGWLHGVEKVHDFKRAKTIDLKSIYDRLCDVLNTGWRFKNHALVVRLLAAHLMSLTVSSIFRKQTAIGIHAETASGKSRLILGLIGGTDFPRINVVPHALGMKSFTVAGLRQKAANSSRPHCLDEFESDNDTQRRVKTVEEVMSMLRTSFTGENNEISMGTQDGRGVTFRLQFPVVFAAITPLKRSQDRNRIISIDMDTKASMTDPETALLMRFGQAHMTQLQHDMGIALLPHIPRVRELQDQMEQKLTVRETLERVKGAARSATALLPALSIMELLGLDSMKFFFEWCEATAEKVEENSVTDTDHLFDAVMNSPQVPYRLSFDSPPVMHTVSQMLLDPLRRATLNGANVGVFLVEDKKMLVVHWASAVQTLLRHHARFSKENGISNVRELSARSSKAITSSEVRRLGLLESLRSQGFAFLHSNQVTVYNVADYLQGELPALNQQGRHTPVAVVKDDSNDFTAA